MPIIAQLMTMKKKTRCLQLETYLWLYFGILGIKTKPLADGEKILLLVPESGRFSYGVVLLTVKKAANQK